MHAAIDDESDVSESFGLAVVKGGDVEYFQGVGGVSECVCPVAERYFLVLRDFGIEADHCLGQDSA